MTDRLVKLVTFSTAAEAGFVKSMLAAAGIHAYVDDDAALTMMSYLGNALGGVKLEVAVEDLARAQQILAEHHDSDDNFSDAEFAAEALAAADPGSREDHATTGSPLEAYHEAEELAHPNTEVVTRALRASILGLFCAPVVIYAVWLIARLAPWKDVLPERDLRRYWLAFGITLNTVCLYLLMLGASIYYSRFHWWQF